MNTIKEGAPRKREGKTPEFKQVKVERLKGDLEPFDPLERYLDIPGARIVPGTENRRQVTVEYPMSHYLATQAEAEERGNSRVRTKRAARGAFTDSIQEGQPLTESELRNFAPVDDIDPDLLNG